MYIRSANLNIGTSRTALPAMLTGSAAGGVRQRTADSWRTKQLVRRRGKLVERTFAHASETGGMRRVHLRGRENVLKRLLIDVGGFNPSLAMGKLLGKGTQRGFP